MLVFLSCCHMITITHKERIKVAVDTPKNRKVKSFAWLTTWQNMYPRKVVLACTSPSLLFSAHRSVYLHHMTYAQMFLWVYHATSCKLWRNAHTAESQLSCTSQHKLSILTSLCELNTSRTGFIAKLSSLPLPDREVRVYGADMCFLFRTMQEFCKDQKFGVI